MIQKEEVIYGINPVIEALRSKRLCLNKIYLQSNRHGREIEEIRLLARGQNTAVLTMERMALNRLVDTDKHQGVVALLASGKYSSVDDILAVSRRREEPPFLFMLDEVEDPRNLGAIIRTAEGAGVHGVIIPGRRAVGLTGAVAKASAGALAHCLVARVVNIADTIDLLKKNHIWVVGVEAEEKCSYLQYDYRGPVAIVFGGEGEGIRRRVLEKCDQLVSLPMRGRISSLNVSVAVGVVAYEVIRQRCLDSKGISRKE